MDGVQTASSPQKPSTEQRLRLASEAGSLTFERYVDVITSVLSLNEEASEWVENAVDVDDDFKQSLRADFNAMDLDGNGTVTVSELLETLQTAEPSSPTKEELAARRVNTDDIELLPTRPPKSPEHVSRVAAFLSNISVRDTANQNLFGKLNKREKDQLAEAMETCSYGKGEDIIVQGAYGDAFYILENGSAEVWIRGVPQPVHAYSVAGEYFGEKALIEDVPRAATVRSTSDHTVCLSVSRTVFKDLFGPMENLFQRQFVLYNSIEVSSKLRRRSRGALEVMSLEGGRQSVDENLSESTRQHLDKLKKRSKKKKVETAATNDHKPVKLGQLMATGICGNDITSSCLYVSALVTVPAGKYAPIALIIVCIVLYFFRKIYTEVITALPLNGGTYNVLLNTSTKGSAMIAAVLTMLSYVSTAVISGASAMYYMQSVVPEISIMWATTALLFVFAMLSIFGISESAGVAAAIFLFHLLSLVLLVIFSIIKVAEGEPGILPNHVNTSWANMSHLSTATQIQINWETTEPEAGFGSALFFGFASAMLGISGFESSANYVEEQAEGVFPLTLRNMWLCVTLINPTTCLLGHCLLPLSDIMAEAKKGGALLSVMAEKSAGQWLKMWIVIDAILVLSGAVLTSYVGFTGLVHRMALDRAMPQALLARNASRGTMHWIILCFFALCAALIFFTGGKVGIMAGVYTISFLSVMVLFTVGNMYLKISRPNLPTEAQASWGTVIMAFLAVVVGLLGNILADAKNVEAFVLFFAVFCIPVFGIKYRVQLLRMLMAVVDPFKKKEKDDGILQLIPDAWFSGFRTSVFNWCDTRVHGWVMKPMVFFTNNDDPQVLAAATMYILANEQRRWIKFVRVYDTEDVLPSDLPPVYASLGEFFPDLQVDYVAVSGEFGPEMINQMSVRLQIPVNFMFMSSFGGEFKHEVADMGGVRLITA